MASAESMVLVVRAKEGDREAWGALCERYYPQWLRAVHGRIGRDVRALCDTPDIVQSAIGDALRDIGDLRSEAAFFSWVSAIIRRKIADKCRTAPPMPPIPLDRVAEPGNDDSPPGGRILSDEAYIRLLDAIIALFPVYPVPMAALYLKHFEKLDLPELMRTFGKSERSTYRLVEIALGLLRSKLGDT